MAGLAAALAFVAAAGLVWARSIAVGVPTTPGPAVPPSPVGWTGPASAIVATATPVTKAIEDVRVGDWVLAENPGDPGPPTPHRVVGLPRNWTQHVVHVRVVGGDGDELQSTREHPFWVDGRGWTNAADLRPGDRLKDAEGHIVAVASTCVENRVCDTYNLTVEGVHTFYALAGKIPVLVHNAVEPWQFGPYNEMQNRVRSEGVSEPVRLHHYPQGQPASEVIPGFNYRTGLTVAVPEPEHTQNLAGTNLKAGEFQGSAQDLLKKASNDLSSRTSIPSSKLEDLNNAAREMYPACK